MKTIKLGGALEASAIGLGCMRMENLDVADAQKVIDAAVESGITFFDHADCYGFGKSEEIFAEALERTDIRREDLVIQSKCGIRKGRGRYPFCKQYYDFSKEHIIEAVDAILGRLKTDYLDTLLLHRPDTLVEPEEVAEAFDILASKGKVRYFGISNESPALVKLLQKELNQRLIVNQLQFSPAHTWMVNQQIYMNMNDGQSVGRSCEVLEYCRDKNITIQAWSPFQHGFFEGTFIGDYEKYPELNQVLDDFAKEKGVTPAAVVIAWILRHPAKIQPIIGSMNPQRIRNIAEGQNIEITKEEWYELYGAAGNVLP
ncbi:aldo/keto reductase family oxidoreductase [Faecalicatena orotica]|uniref:Putative oxidoreductase n=1 Tax=Faecalicatena orotica TaxID=1544 RepID=A0A2Y9CA02_9FIRM|nr:aldo/keto reductase [Faecalicatena orotica]PWJ29964.1 putative oxidoreductase [Faecalicatena orotica]SSA55690.1 Predicted oxidoreductase [Faecalicatena orotica]